MPRHSHPESSPGGDPRFEPGSSRYRRALIALFCAGLAGFMPLYSAQGLLPDISREFGVAASTSSWAVGSATIGVAVGVIPWAALSDRIGRIRAMRWAVLIGVCAGLGVPLAPNFGSLIALCFLEGAALAGVPGIAVTALAEMVTPTALGSAVGNYIAGNTIGGLSGRFISAWIGDLLGWRLGLVSVIIVAALSALAFSLLVPPTMVAPKPMPMVRGILANLRDPGVMSPVTQGFLLMGGFVSVYNYLTFRLQRPPFDLSLAQVLPIFLAYLAGAVASKIAWGIAPRVSPSGSQLIFLSVMTIGLLLMLIPLLLPVVIGLILVTAGFFGAHSIASGLAPFRAKQAQSMVTPLYNFSFYVGSSVLGWASGLAFAARGWVGTSAVVAILILLTGALSWWYPARHGGLRAADGY